jgi:hypothetical protein
MSNATWLADVLRAADCKVVEVEGWQTRGRPGAFGPVRGVICHHTGATGSVASAVHLIKEGRLDETPPLHGPLSQLVLDKDGTFYVVAAGRCNHAGPGRWQGTTEGNTQFIGIEARNDGAGEPWPWQQMDAYAKGVAAILKHQGADAVMAVGHKEWALPKGRRWTGTLDRPRTRPCASSNRPMDLPATARWVQRHGRRSASNRRCTCQR